VGIISITKEGCVQGKRFGVVRERKVPWWREKGDKGFYSSFWIVDGYLKPD
jgi:hypothetical protein